MSYRGHLLPCDDCTDGPRVGEGVDPSGRVGGGGAVSTKMTKVCDNCGSEHDAAWYWLMGGCASAACSQPDIANTDDTEEGIDLCGCCWQILRETLDVRCFGEVEP